MTDKVQKIREGVERLKSQLLRGACSSQITMETMCKEEAYNEVLAILDTMQEEPVSGLDNGDMPIKRWKQAVKAASNQRSYRSSKGLTETRDDYFVDGVQWADEHPKEEPASKIIIEGTKFNKSWYAHPELAFKAGAKWQITKLVEEAGKHEVKVDAGGYPYIPQIELYDYLEDIPLAKEGDKYKVILIKE